MQSLDHAYRLYGPALQTTARRVLGSDDDASDCVHDVLVRYLRRPEAYRPERGELRTYLIVAVRNEAISRVRRERRHAELERASLDGRTETYVLDVPDSVDVARLRRALDALPGDERAALDLAYNRGLTHTEIAARLGVPLGTIKSRLARAVRRLGEAMR